MTQVDKFLGKVIDDLGKTICARVCDWCNEIALGRLERGTSLALVEECFKDHSW
jgi:hypothetical protein